MDIDIDKGMDMDNNYLDKQGKDMELDNKYYCSIYYCYLTKMVLIRLLHLQVVEPIIVLLFHL